MKVLHINTSDTGGAAIACIRQHLALLENGINSFLLTLTKSRNDIPNHFTYNELIKPDDNTSLINRVMQRLKKEVYKSAFEKRKLYENNLNALQEEASKTTECFSLIDTNYRIDLIPGIEGYDVINLHWVARFLDWSTFFLSPKIKNIVWTLHDMNPFTGGYHYAGGYEGYKQDDAHPTFLLNTFNPNFAQEQLIKKRSIISNTKAEIKFTAPSRWLLNCSKQSSLFSKFEHYLVPYSLNTNNFKPLNKYFCREALNIPQDKKTILFVSDLLNNKRKGFSILIQALSNLESKDIVLCCIGRGSGFDLPGGEQIQLGSITDERVMALAYNAADLFVLPSKEDNLPNVVLESLCCGTPVVGFNIGGMPDMVKNGENGILCNNISSEQLSQAMEKEINNLAKFDKKEISQNASNKYQRFKQAEALKVLYQSFKN